MGTRGQAWVAALATAALLACGGGQGAADPGTDTAVPDVPSDVARDDGPSPDPGTDRGPADPGGDPGADAAGDPAIVDPGAADVPSDPGADPADAPPEDTYRVDVVAPPEVILDEGPDVPTEYFDCLALHTCVEGCGVDTNCRNRCLRRGSADALADLDALDACLYRVCDLGQCLNTACGTCPDPDGCGACQEDAVAFDCLQEATPCVVIGGDPCATVLGCILGCKDATCGYACVDRLSPRAKPLLDPVGECVNTACPGMDGPWGSPCVQAAAQGTCKTLVDACMAQTSFGPAPRR